MKDLIIIGAGGLGREVAWLVERINQDKRSWNLLGFVDDSEELQGKEINGYKVLGKSKWLLEQKSGMEVVCAVGSSLIRKKITEGLEDIKFATLIDPSVIGSDRVKIGCGCIICAGTIMTVDISLDDHVIINPNCTIGHDSDLKKFVTLYPSVNVSGNTLLGECVEVGTGSQIIQNKKIGRGTIVGAGAVVVKDLPESCTAIGIPAVPIKYR
jgi:sugar O-acyltransferase (sialic acid O-acetyltransferase NeuD family)